MIEVELDSDLDGDWLNVLIFVVVNFRGFDEGGDNEFNVGFWEVEKIGKLEIVEKWFIILDVELGDEGMIIDGVFIFELKEFDFEVFIVDFFKVVLLVVVFENIISFFVVVKRLEGILFDGVLIVIESISVNVEVFDIIFLDVVIVIEFCDWCDNGFDVIVVRVWLLIDGLIIVVNEEILVKMFVLGVDVNKIVFDDKIDFLMFLVFIVLLYNINWEMILLSVIFCKVILLRFWNFIGEVDVVMDFFVWRRFEDLIEDFKWEVLIFFGLVDVVVVRLCVFDILGVVIIENDDGIGLFFGVIFIVEVFSDFDVEIVIVWENNFLVCCCDELSCIWFESGIWDG